MTDAAVGRPLLRRGLGFLGLPLLSLLTPFLALPILARFASVEQWSAIAIGQSVGAMAAIVGSWGYSVTGPAEVSQSAPEDRVHLWVESLHVRSRTTLAILPVVCVVALVVQGTSAHWLCAVTAVGTSLSALTISWFAIGSGRPGALAAYDAVPRSVGNILGAFLAVRTGHIIVYPLAVLFSVLAPVALFTFRELRTVTTTPPPRAIRARLRRNLSPMATEVSAGAYSVAAATLVASTSGPAVVAQFNSGERVTRMGSMSIVVTGNSLQAWVSEAKGPEFVRRARVSLAAHAGVGFTGFLVMALGGPLITRILFGPRLEISRYSGIAFGVFFLFWSTETTLGRHVLASRGRTRELFLTTAGGGLMGVVLVLVGSKLAGAEGAASALAITVATIGACQWTVVRSVFAAELAAPREPSGLDAPAQVSDRRGTGSSAGRHRRESPVRGSGRRG